MLKCRNCGAPLEITAASCAQCGAEVEMGRLTGILGIVCRKCDAYNEPGAKVCVGCGEPLARPARPAPAAAGAAPGGPVVRAFPRPAPAGTPPAGASEETPIPLVTICPSCGGEAGAGQFCARCGHPLGGRGAAAAPARHGPRAATQILGAVEPGKARLVLERGEGLDGAVFRLQGPEVAAGRSKGEVTFPNDPCLAELHATFLYRDGSLHLRDEGAPGGVYLRLRGLSVPLKPGDLFAVGDHLLRFGGPVAPPSPALPDGTRRLGSPRPPGTAILIEERLEGGTGGRVYLRPGPSVTIGRAGCTINLGDDPWLSQAHAEIQVDPEGHAKLKDLGSANGTFLRLPPRAERELHDGDMLRMGREVLRVQIA